MVYQICRKLKIKQNILCNYLLCFIYFIKQIEWNLLTLMLRFVIIFNY